MTKYISRAAIAAAALALGVSGANATNLSTGTLSVTADVVTACIVTGGALAFGNVASGNGAAAPSTDVSVNCPVKVGYTVNLGQGGNWDNVNGKWQVADSGGNLIGYRLQNNADAGSNWLPATGTGTGAAVPLTIYGVLDTVGSQPAGHYTDSVQIQVTY